MVGADYQVDLVSMEKKIADGLSSGSATRSWSTCSARHSAKIANLRNIIGEARHRFVLVFSPALRARRTAISRP
jgi:hypothetical protein